MWSRQLAVVLQVLLVNPTAASRSITIAYDGSLRPAAYGAGRLRGAVIRAGADAKLATTLSLDSEVAPEVMVELQDQAGGSEQGASVEGAFTIDRDQASRNGTQPAKVRLAAADGAGAMYACLELAERLDTYMLGHHDPSTANLVWDEFVDSLPLPLVIEPRFEYRALKFNLPWSAYRPGNATVENYNLCRNLTFWASFLDMMAENRYNVITLWALHPWPCV